MKSTLLAILLTFAVFLTAWTQTIRLVDNTASKPSGAHVYSSLQAAVDSATAGDIIHVKGSETGYGSVTITKQLTLFGIGFNPNKDIPKISILEDVYLNAGSSGTRISGFDINYIYLHNASGTYTISDLLIDNNKIDKINLGGTCCSFSGGIDRMIIRNNIIGIDNYTSFPLDFQGYYSTATNVVITNNIIMDYYGTGDGSIYGNGLLIKNNLFYGGNTTAYEAFEVITNSTISNNIFYGCTPDADYTSESNVFNNNLSFSTVNDSLPAAGKFNGTAGSGKGNTGSGNLQATQPFMVNTSIGTAWSFSFDVTPQSGSPLLNAGTDGTNIGPTGGTTPWDNTGVALPLIKTISANDVVKQGDNLNVEVKAEGNN